MQPYDVGFFDLAKMIIFFILLEILEITTTFRRVSMSYGINIK